MKYNIVVFDYCSATGRTDLMEDLYFFGKSAVDKINTLLNTDLRLIDVAEYNNRVCMVSGNRPFSIYEILTFLYQLADDFGQPDNGYHGAPEHIRDYAIYTVPIMADPPMIGFIEEGKELKLENLVPIFKIVKEDYMINKPVEAKPEAKEKRVYVVNADNAEEFDFRGAEHRGDFEAIKQHAEMTGLVYSLQGFQDACNDEEMDFANSFIFID